MKRFIAILAFAGLVAFAANSLLTSAEHTINSHNSRTAEQLANI